MNDLYWNEQDFYKNFFLPNKKLIEKKRIDAKIAKRYDKARTPYQRLLENGELPEVEKTKLKMIYERLNPAEIKISFTPNFTMLHGISTTPSPLFLIIIIDFWTLNLGEPQAESDVTESGLCGDKVWSKGL